MSKQSEEVLELTETLRPYLADREPAVVGAALANLVAILLAGHMVLDDAGEIARETTEAVREDLLDLHIQTIRELVPVTEAEMREACKNEAN